MTKSEIKIPDTKPKEPSIGDIVNSGEKHVFITDWSDCEQVFSGVVISGSSFGLYLSSWSKSAFRPAIVGTVITLTQQ